MWSDPKPTPFPKTGTQLQVLRQQGVLGVRLGFPPHLYNDLMARGLVAAFQAVCEVVPFKSAVTLVGATPTEIELRLAPR